MDQFKWLRWHTVKKIKDFYVFKDKFGITIKFMWPNFILRISRPFLLEISVGNSHGRGFGAGIPYFGFK